MKIHFDHLVARFKNIRARSKSRFDKDLVGILIVNGGEDPKEGKWLSLSLRKITEHTKWPNYRIYVWNNNTHDLSVSKEVKNTPHAVLFNAESDGKIEHVHAVPLQKLYENARKDGAKYIVTFDTDAFPFKDNWIRCLVQHLDEHTVLAGVWRDELKTIEPYIHPSCLCTSVDFIEKNKIRFDAVDIDSDKKMDTLSSFSAIAVKNGENLFKLCRSNINQLHHIMGGVYGDLVYHQGAGSRKGVFFWGEERTDSIFQRNSRIRETLNRLVFNYQTQFINWLLGMDQIDELSPRRSKCVFILGMDGRGLDFLAGLLKRCGLSICDGKKSYKEIIDYAPGDSKCGIIDANGISIIEQLPEIPEKIQLVGNYQHPLAVARFLKKTHNLSTQKGLELWVAYNNRLVQLHRKFKFPLLKFDLTSPGHTINTVAQLSVHLGLNPDLKELNDFIGAHPVHERETEPIQDSCLVLFEYLEENSYQIKSDSFSFHLLKLKKDLL